MSLKRTTSKEEEYKPVDLLSSRLEEELLQQEMGNFLLMTVKTRGLMVALAVVIPDAFFLISGILGCFNVAGSRIDFWQNFAYLAIGLVGFALSFLMWRMTYVAFITLLRAAYLLVTGLACLIIGTKGLIGLSDNSHYLFLSLIHVNMLNGVMWLILGLLSILTPLLLVYSAFRYYLALMAYGQLW